MNSLPKRLLSGLVGVLVFATMAAGLTLVVKYKPYGVPDSRRQEYEEKIAAIEAQARLISNPDGQARPVAVVPVKTHSFGMLNPHTTATHSFEVRNEGDDPLALEVRQTSCKCTVGNLSDSLLAPGESTTVTMTWNTGYQADKYTQTATIITNDPLARSITLTVTGEVRAELIVPAEFHFRGSNPAETTSADFVVFSQLWDDFELISAESELKGFEWNAEPIDSGDPELFDKEAKSAWRIRVTAYAEDYGMFEDQIKLTFRPSSGDEIVERTVTGRGKVRAPISFVSPLIHKSEGLDIGTLLAGQDHHFHLVVRSRGDQSRELQVLDVQPEQLQASLEPATKPGSYRLTVTVPADCPHLVFNANQQHGFVQVGDPHDPRYMNWFPVFGAVTTVK